MINEIIVVIMFLIGSIFMFLGALGLMRMPDLYNRLQAGTKATTLGIIFTILGLGIYYPEIIFKAILIVLFILMSNPVSSSTLARSAYKKGIKYYEKTINEVEDICLK